MADDAGRCPSPYHVQKDYGITETIALLTAYRIFVAKLARPHGHRISAQSISDVVDDVFCTFSHWTEIQDKHFIAIFNTRLDPHTLRKFLRCDLDITVRKIHPRSLRVLDAFLQIVEREPPHFLVPYLRE
jgi:hypothetical protein